MGGDILFHNKYEFIYYCGAIIPDAIPLIRSISLPLNIIHCYRLSRVIYDTIIISIEWLIYNLALQIIASNSKQSQF